jgi:hypothetical protein
LALARAFNYGVRKGGGPVSFPSIRRSRQRAGAHPEWSSKGDVAYVPRVVYTTGHLDAHDLTVDAQSRVVFVNTLFGCLATKTVTI